MDKKTMKGIQVGWLLLFSVLAFGTNGIGQVVFQPYSYQFYQKLNTEVFNNTTGMHTSLKHYIIPEEGELRQHYDSLMTPDKKDTSKNILHQMFFNGHIWSEKNSDFTLNFDFLPDFMVGKESNEKVTTWLNTRGVQLSGTVGKKFYFYTSLYENQGRFANYENNYISNVSFGMVPGQAYDRAVPKSDWAYVSTIMGYKFNDKVNVALGEDKTFIGDGYRSVLLSDFAAPYPLLRLNVNLCKNVQYTAMWAYFEDQKAKQFYVYGNDRRKWGAFHYIDWNINHNASIGFFNALVTEEVNEQNIAHGFDLNYINPLYFTSAIQPAGTVTDHTLLGLNGKYKVLNKTTVYGQLLIDKTSEVSFGKRNAWQLGFRGSDLFTAKRLNYLFEYNTAKPYTYSSQASINNYAQYNETLAHPLGANFKEWLGILNYSIKRFDFQCQINYAEYGLNTNGINYGKLITLADNSKIPTGDINSTGQGLATTLKYAEGTIAYVLNPKYNLRFEVTALLRDEKNTKTETKTTMISFGLRGSFRNLYHDF